MARVDLFHTTKGTARSLHYQMHMHLKLKPPSAMPYELTKIFWYNSGEIDTILQKMVDIYEGQDYWGWEIDYNLYDENPGSITGAEEKIINDWLKSEGGLPGENVLIDMGQ